MAAASHVFARWRAAGLLPVTVAAAVAFAILLSLGTWQMARRAWKEGLLAAMSERARAAPVIAETWRDLGCRPDAVSVDRDPCDFRPVRLTVTFDHAGERHVFISVPRQANGVGGPGYWVFTPARVEGGARFYVNRGFVPEAQKARTIRASGEVAGPVQVDGLLRRAEPRGRFSNANDPARNVYYVRDPVEFGIEPEAPAPPTRPSPRLYYIDMTGPTPPGGLPLPLAGRIAIPNRHLEYALTWYALALTLVGVFAAFARRRVAEAVSTG
jgi:surfeit locus 1 family protein